MKNIYGTRPNPIRQQSVDPSEASGQKLETDAENLNEANEVANNLATADLESLMSNLERYFPGFTEGTKESFSLANSWQKGELGDDFKQQLSRRAAERGISLGFDPDSQFVNFGELANYGLTTYGVQQQGMNAMNTLRSQAQGFVSPSQQLRQNYIGSSFLSASEMLAANQREAENAMQISSYNNSLQAMPDASAVARANEQRMNRVSAISTRNSSGFMGYAGGASNPFTGGLSAKHNRQGYRSS